MWCCWCGNRLNDVPWSKVQCFPEGQRLAFLPLSVSSTNPGSTITQPPPQLIILSYGLDKRRCMFERGEGIGRIDAERGRACRSMAFRECVEVERGLRAGVGVFVCSVLRGTLVVVVG